MLLVDVKQFCLDVEACDVTGGRAVFKLVGGVAGRTEGLGGRGG